MNTLSLYSFANAIFVAIGVITPIALLLVYTVLLSQSISSLAEPHACEPYIVTPEVVLLVRQGAYITIAAPLGSQLIEVLSMRRVGLLRRSAQRYATVYAPVFLSAFPAFQALVIVLCIVLQLKLLFSAQRHVSSDLFVTPFIHTLSIACILIFALSSQ